MKCQYVHRCKCNIQNSQTIIKESVGKTIRVVIMAFGLILVNIKEYI